MGLTAKGVPGGLATLDSNGDLPAAQVAPGATVANPAALTSAAASGGDAPTEAEYNALRTDVSNLRTTVQNLLTSLRSAGLLTP